MPSKTSRECVHCGGTFEVTLGRPGRPRAYCSTQCYQQGSRVTVTSACEQCGTEFTGGRSQRFCSTECQCMSRNLARRSHYERECPECGEAFATRDNRQRYCAPSCCDKARGRTPKRKAHHRNMHHARRTATRQTDLTGADITALLASAKTCPLCRKRLTGRHPAPNSPQVDHIVPINAGGTHTRSNVRVICFRCNLSRLNDGSDYTGQLGLGAIRDGV